jgi:hypothetical protein
MTAWRRAIEVSIGGEDLPKLVSITRSRTEPASRVERARMLLAYREDPSFFAAGRALGCIIRRSSAASSGRWPVVQWRRSTIARGPAGRRRSPPPIEGAIMRNPQWRVVQTT